MGDIFMAFINAAFDPRILPYWGVPFVIALTFELLGIALGRGKQR